MINELLTKETHTTAEAAAYIQKSVPTVLKEIYSRRLPASRHGNAWVLQRRDLDIWIERYGRRR